jgi:hypothetical protein
VRRGSVGGVGSVSERELQVALERAGCNDPRGGPTAPLYSPTLSTKSVKSSGLSSVLLAIKVATRMHQSDTPL